MNVAESYSINQLKVLLIFQYVYSPLLPIRSFFLTLDIEYIPRIKSFYAKDWLEILKNNTEFPFINLTV